MQSVKNLNTEKNKKGLYLVVVLSLELKKVEIRNWEVERERERERDEKCRKFMEDPKQTECNQGERKKKRLKSKQLL